MLKLYNKIKVNTKKVLAICSSTGFFYAVLMLLPTKVLGADGDIASIKNEMNNKVKLAQEGKDGNLIMFVSNVINFAVTVIGIAAVAFLIYGGVLFITAGGDEAKVDKATKAITQALIGLAIVLLSGLIINFVISQITKQMSGSTGGGGTT